MDKSAWRCSCQAMNTWAMSFCELCGDPRPIEAGKPSSAPSPAVSCWTCTRCKVRSPGQPTIMGLCGACHFEVNIRPHVSKPTDVCTAPECDGQARHLVGRHVAEFRAHMARISERAEEIRL